MNKSNRGVTLSTKHAPVICPHCGNALTRRLHHSTKLDIDNGLVTAVYRCDQCGYYWDEAYTMQYAGYDDGYYKYDKDGAALTTSELDYHRCENKWLK